jgi:putative mycofactocin binding protein MftB
MNPVIALTACYQLAPGVAIRPERFGGLVYRYDNRRLYFLHSHQAVAFIKRLDGSQSLQKHLDDFLADRQMPQSVGESLVNAVLQLERLGLLTHSV